MVRRARLYFVRFLVSFSARARRVAFDDGTLTDVNDGVSGVRRLFSARRCRLRFGVADCDTS